MNNERNLLAALIKDREAYRSVKDSIKEGDLTEQGNVILGAIQEYYDRDTEASCIDSDLLERNINRKLTNPKHKDMFTGLIAALTAAEVSPENVVHDFIEVRRESVGSQLASALVGKRQGKEVSDLLSEFKKWQDASSILDIQAGRDSEVLRGMSVIDVVEDNYEKDRLIKVWPESLNKRLDGGLLRGHHMLLFARPEMGKTLTLVNMIAGFLSQNLTVLYVGNEDPVTDIVMRMVSRLTGMTKYEILDDPATADELARMKGYDNLILAALAPGTPAEIQALIDEHEPDVLCIDQLRNINVSEEQFVQKLEKAATVARNIGKSNDLLVVSVTQAGDSASGKGPLDMGDVDSSNTGIPAQVDVMVGIGANNDDLDRGRRVLSLPKNKRSGDHGFFSVGVDEQLNEVRSLG